MVNITEIKLIIWDLDDTFWLGTLSEGGIQLPDAHKQLIRDLTDAGIINSICSKNEYEPTKNTLKKLGLWDYFVFASINWDSKGLRLKNMIDQMALRPINVLFVDDNTFNLQEAKHFLPDLQIAAPDVIPDIIQQLLLLPKKDIAHKRLNQYKVLEEKAVSAKSYDSNEAFLFASNIQVTMHTNCMAIIERLHELILRTNQLNFTKKRITRQELESILQDPEYECGYVSVTDNYGDYGVVGFYAKISNRLEHFVFSCRTMGQMIEQYVYAQLMFPELDVVGEVHTRLNKTDCPPWINQICIETSTNLHISSCDVSMCKILVKGPCDLSNSLSYIHASDNIVSEFTYVDKRGIVVDTYNHSVHIRGLYEYTEADNQMLLSDCSFIDPAMLHGSFFSGDYDMIFLSSLFESSYNIYRRKGTNLEVVINSYNNHMESDPIFLAKYEYIGYTTAEKYIAFLNDCLKWLPRKTKICIILGATYNPTGENDEAIRHQSINKAVKELAMHEKRILYIDVDEYANCAADFTDSLNHYQTRVYYEIAQSMMQVVNQSIGVELKSYGAYKILSDKVLKSLRNRAVKYLKHESRIFYILQKQYRKMVGKKR